MNYEQANHTPRDERVGRKDLEEVSRSSVGAEIMNERIQELIQQATRVIEPDDPDYRQEIFDKKLFAELIVLECAPFVGDENSQAVRQMFEHFGIE